MVLKEITLSVFRINNAWGYASWRELTFAHRLKFRHSFSREHNTNV